MFLFQWNTTGFSKGQYNLSLCVSPVDGETELGNNCAYEWVLVTVAGDFDGDRDVDILAGQAASVRTCFFGSGLEEAAADFTITDYATLHRLLVAENDRSGDNTPPDKQGG